MDSDQWLIYEVRGLKLGLGKLYLPRGPQKTFRRHRLRRSVRQLLRDTTLELTQSSYTLLFNHNT